MIEDLEKLGIDEDLKNKIINNNNYDIAFSLACNYKNVGNIINYLKELDIRNIEELLIVNPTMFLLEKNYIKEKFSKFTSEELSVLLYENAHLTFDILN